MAQTAGGTYYAASSELVSSWPATSLDLANQLESRFAAKAPNVTLPQLGTANLTGAATITISGLAAKNFLYVWITGASSASASSILSIRFNSDTGANYGRIGIGFVGTGTSQVGDTAATNIAIAQIGNSAADTVNASMIIVGAGGTGWKPYTATSYATGSATNTPLAISGLWAGTSAISSVSIISGTGNFDAGTIQVYGG